MKLKFIFIVISTLLILHTHLQAQPLQLAVRDAETGLPVAHASFKYGTLHGVADNKGNIAITYQPGLVLHVSHISYKDVKLSGNALKNASGSTVLMEPMVQALSPVTVVGLRGKLPQKMRKLEQADRIQHDAAQVLQQVAGFSAVRKSGTYGWDPVFRGFKQEQLNVVSDGLLSAYAACPNRMDPPTSQVMINQAEQMEVLKGPHSFRYGPSMGAVIHFKSAEPVFTEKPIPFGRVSSGYETNGSIFRTEGMAGIRTEKLQLHTLASYSKGSDYRDGNDTLIPARFNRGAAGMYLYYQPKAQQLLSAGIVRNFSRNTSFPTLMMDLLSDDTWMLQAGYKVRSTTRWYQQWETQVAASLVDHSMGNRLRPAAANVLSHVHATTQTVNGRTEFTMRHKGGLLYAGADFKFEAANGNRTRKMMTGPMAGKVFTDTVWQDARQWRTGVFADWYVQAGAYKLSFAGRVDAVQADANNVAAAFNKLYPATTATDINPSFSAGISRQFSSRVFAGAWLGRGVRSASLTERFINFLPVGLDPYEVVGNPMLQPEANLQQDVTVAWNHPNGSVEFNAYTSWVRNYITAVINPALQPRFASAPGVRQFINVKQARLHGFELSWTQRWLPVLQQNVTIAYTWGRNTITGNPLPEIAPLDARFRWEAPLQNGKWQPYALVRYVAAQNRVAPDFGERRTKEFSTIDVGVTMHPVKQLQLHIAAANLLNKTYREHLSRYINAQQPLNAPGRSFIVMMVYHF
ncbi:MAG: TonB-dependent receptor domain-containing protein [Lacibacter sp.]